MADEQLAASVAEVNLGDGMNGSSSSAAAADEMAWKKGLKPPPKDNRVKTKVTVYEERIYKSLPFTAGRHRHKGLRVRGLCAQARVAYGHLREGLGAAIAHSGVGHSCSAFR